MSALQSINSNSSSPTDSMQNSVKDSGDPMQNNNNNSKSILSYSALQINNNNSNTNAINSGNTATGMQYFEFYNILRITRYRAGLICHPFFS